MKILKLFFPLILIMAVTDFAHAIVNMESVHFGKPREGNSGALDINASGEFGNTDKSAVSTAIKLVRQKNPATNFILLSHEYGENSGVRDKNKSFMHGRHIQHLTEKYAWEGFVQASDDEFTRLTLRVLFGTGARIALWKESDVAEGFLGLGGFYEREKLDMDQAANRDDSGESWRGNMYYVIKVKFNNYVSVISTTYYQPDLQQFSDFRATESASLVSKLSETLVAKISLNVSHDSEPPPAVKKTDTAVNFGFELNF